MNPQSDKDPRNLEHWEESEVLVFSIESTSDSTIVHTKNYESSKAICESQCSVFQIDNPTKKTSIAAGTKYEGELS